MNIVEKHEKYEKAIKVIDKILTDKGENYDMLNTKGLYSTYLGRFEDAIELYKRVLENSPTHTYAYYNIAVAKVRAFGINKDTMNDIQTAREMLEKEKDSMPYYYGFAGLTSLEGNRNDTIRFLKQAISMSSKAITWAKHDTAFLELRGDEAFQKLFITPQSTDANN